MKTSLIAGIAVSLLFNVLFITTVHATRYSLALGVQGDGTVTPDNTNSPYPAGVVVTLTAAASNGWYFDHWSGNASGNVNPLPLTMNSDLSVTGNFVAYPSYSLALATNGQGTIGLTPPGGNYYSNTTIVVTATPAAGWVFAQWSGAFSGTNNPLSFAMDTNLSLIGTFGQLPAFDQQPASITNAAGGTVSFTAHAVGSKLLSYDWYFNGGLLADATGTTLTLTNITISEAGNYWVVATNGFGSATSYVATLTIPDAIRPTNVVTSPDEGSLRAAIAQGGWVGIALNSTLTLTNTISITNNVILDGSGTTAVISGGNTVGLFNVASGASLTISNLTLANGNAHLGAAIDCSTGAVVAVGCVFTNNDAVFGGAIYNLGGTLTLVGSTFSGNGVVANAGIINSDVCSGGAVYQASGSMTALNCLFLSNFAESTNEGQPTSGGACTLLGGSGAINRSQFLGNSANGSGSDLGSPGYGGAIYSSALLAINDSTFARNQAIADGFVVNHLGGVGTAAGGAIYNLGTAILNRCSVYSNSIQSGTAFPPTYSFASTGGLALGGGIYNAAQLMATNCTLAFNTATGGGAGTFEDVGVAGSALGGGIYNASSSAVSAMNLTIAANACLSPAGQYCTSGQAAGAQVANTNGSFFLHNSILAYGGTNSNAYGSITDDGYNISSDNSAALDSGSSFNNTDPMLGSLGNYGGPTLCLALLANSPAIDNADPSDFPSTDQRRYVRPFGAGPDIGAFEYEATAPAAPRLIAFSGAAGVGVSFDALPAFTYRIQSSPDLKTWTDVMSIGPLATETDINQMVTPPWYSNCYFRLIRQ